MAMGPMAHGTHFYNIFLFKKYNFITFVIFKDDGFKDSWLIYIRMSRVTLLDLKYYKL